MSACPQSLTIDGAEFRLERLLKEDFFSVNGLYIDDTGRGQVLKISDFRFIFGFLLRPVAAFMSAHEFKMYRKLQGIPGIPGASMRYGWRGFVHEYAEGRTLEPLEPGDVSAAFFDQLRDLMRAIHERNVIYLDSNKQGNIILGDDGLPKLIDFQISINFGMSRPIFWWLFKILAREDMYHVFKHKRNFGHSLTPEEAALAKRSAVNQVIGVGIGRPYRWLKRLIYPSGSNEIIWYKWRKKDKPPVYGE